MERLSRATPSRPWPALWASFRLGAAMARAGGVLLLVLLGPENVFTSVAVFFSQVAMVSFGGAYAVLAYVSQQAVEIIAGCSRARCSRARHRGDDARPAHHGHPSIVGFLAGYRGPGVFAAAAGGHAGRSARRLGNLYALLSLGVSGGAPMSRRCAARARSAPAYPPSPPRWSEDHSEPRGLVRPPRRLSPDGCRGTAMGSAWTFPCRGVSTRSQRSWPLPPRSRYSGSRSALMSNLARLLACRRGAPARL